MKRFYENEDQEIHVHFSWAILYLFEIKSGHNFKFINLKHNLGIGMMIIQNGKCESCDIYFVRYISM